MRSNSLLFFFVHKVCSSEFLGIKFEKARLKPHKTFSIRSLKLSSLQHYLIDIFDDRKMSIMMNSLGSYRDSVEIVRETHKRLRSI